MTGFKTGASDSGLEDDADVDAAEAEAEDERSTGDIARDQSSGDREPRGATASDASGGLPWIYQRSGISDGRAKTVQLHLQQTTLNEEREAKTQLESALGETVHKADLREAAYLVGLAHLEGVQSHLREWGYDAE